MRYDLALLAVAAIWGMGFVAADIAMEKFSPILITAVRFSIAGSLFFALVAKRLRRPLPWWPGFVVGALLALGFIFQTVALRYTTPAKNAFLTSTNVIMTPFVYLIFTRNPVRLKTFFGAFLALLGIALLNFDGAQTLSNTGDLLTLVCAVFFALQIYFTGHYLKEKKLPLESMVLLQFAFAAAISWFLALLLEDFPLGSFLAASASQSGLSLLFLGFFSTMLCFFLQNFAQRKVNPNKAAIILSSEALFGTLFSVLLRGEVLNRYMLLGFAVMFCAILVTELRGKTQKK